MKKKLVVALDAMGGDHAPEIVVSGAEIARERYPDVDFVFFGRDGEIAPLLQSHEALSAISRIVHTDEVVAATDKPSQVVRRGRSSSMGLAIQAVKDGDVDVAVSAGNTGALMALAKVMLRTMPGIDRPALASLLPTYRGDSIMLDLGANIECDADNLVQFAVMGAAFARTVLGLSDPKVGLLNVGVEELKGNETIKSAAERLRDAPLPMEFCGFVEGDSIGRGDVDVIVTDGFTGNVALKTIEGTARLISRHLHDAFRSSLTTRLGYVLASKSLTALRDHLDPNHHNGGVFLGLNGLVVKSHGGANDKGYACAIGVAVDMARNQVLDLIDRDLENFKGHEEAKTPLVESS